MHLTTTASIKQTEWEEPHIVILASSTTRCREQPVALCQQLVAPRGSASRPLRHVDVSSRAICSLRLERPDSSGNAPRARAPTDWCRPNWRRRRLQRSRGSGGSLCVLGHHGWSRFRLFSTTNLTNVELSGFPPFPATTGWFTKPRLSTALGCLATLGLLCTATQYE